MERLSRGRDCLSEESVYVVSDIQGCRDMEGNRVCKDTLWSWSLDVEGMVDFPRFTCHQCADHSRYQRDIHPWLYFSTASHTDPETH